MLLAFLVHATDIPASTSFASIDHPLYKYCIGSMSEIKLRKATKKRTLFALAKSVFKKLDSLVGGANSCSPCWLRCDSNVRSITNAAGIKLRTLRNSSFERRSGQIESCDAIRRRHHSLLILLTAMIELSPH